ncbi:Fe(3+) ABC transporter substrate-binding protein [Hydrogenibacillus sp. N12]|uniref:Fe(3+) ABC transporter substrate-binding protein n=1 Tax=Hydrogenibacillus sp. N12 TaxID=2866627 RepID=UPI00207BE37C|nr:Fe(3+) ABC transporter substrate-binding protein [Hydrogenibacillus sp. N12]
MHLRSVSAAARPLALFLLVFSFVLLAACGQATGGPAGGDAARSEGAAAGSENAGTDAAAGGEGSAGKAAAEPPVVHVYTARHYDADQALFDDFTKETGIEVKVVSGKAEELIERIAREGDATEADVFITVDGGVLNRAKERGILAPIDDEAILQNVPAELRDRENAWVGLATRARVIVYAKDRVKPDDLSTYEALTDPKWRGKVLVRSSTSLYNQSLLASFIALNGRDWAKRWAEGMVKNFARPPEGNDRDQMKAIAAGVGDVALVNTYYVGLLLTSEDPKEREVGAKIGVFFPDQTGHGTHINVSGAGLVKGAKHPENAKKLLAYLTSVPAQEKLAALNFEYPANPKARWPELLESWGRFKPQTLDFADLGRYNEEAVKIFAEVGWK